MNRQSAIPLMLASVLLAPPALRAAPGPAAGDLEAVNADLRGHVAIIELFDGQRIEGARKVAVNRALTSWKAPGARQRYGIPTDEVARIWVRKKRGLHGAAIGAFVGAALGLMTQDDSTYCHRRHAPSQADRVLANAAAGAAAGYDIATSGPPHYRLVYEAELLAGPRFGGR